MALVPIPLPSAIPMHKNKKGESFCVLLEAIQDPGNLGSILRSAAAAGANNVYLSDGCADAWSPKTLRAAMGAHFLLRINERLIWQQWRGHSTAKSLPRRYKRK